MSISRALVAVILLLLAAAAPPVSADTAPAPQANDIPLFDGVKKTPPQLAADARFVKEVTAAAGSKGKAADAMIDKGWKAVQSGDFRTAVHRFNQAYLLNPSDHRLYWGLGVTVSAAGDLDRAIALFKRGEPFAGKDSRFYCDYGYAVQNSAVRAMQSGTDPAKDLSRSEALYTKCRDLAPNTALPYSYLAVSAFFRGSCPDAKRLIGESQKRGGEGLDPRLLKDVSQHCP